MAPPHRPRRLRLPQRLDYTLIPAPLDLSLPSITEKSHLPAIIVTPSSPTFDKNFYIAFLAPEPQPTLAERIKTSITSPIKPSFPSASTSTTSWKTNAFKMTMRLMFILSLMMFVMAVHVITHRLATQRPHLDFRVMNSAEDGGSVGSWFGFRGLWASNDDDLGISTGSHDIGSTTAVAIPVEGGAWISSDAIQTSNEKNDGHGHGHGSQERDTFVVIEDPPAASPQAQTQPQDAPPAN